MHVTLKKGRTKIWSLRQGGMEALISLKAKNEEILKNFILPLTRSKTVLPILGAYR